MANDKKISQLPVASAIAPTDISVLVDANLTEQFPFSLLATFLSAYLPLGAVISFGTGSIPGPCVGNNGDLYIKTDTGQFAQKVSGSWVVQYTVTPGVVGSKIYYGSTTPSSGTGINGDTYLQTVGGIFYSKIAGVWVTEFSMATGPTGPQGPAGTNGTNGTDGKTVLSGSVNPSNSLGVDGDFYINVGAWTIFGPKSAGAWPAGVSIIGPSTTLPDDSPTPITAGVTPTPLTVNYDNTIYTSAKYSLVRTSDGTYDWNTNVIPVRNPVSGSAHFIINGATSDGSTFADGYVFTVMA